MVCLRCGGGVVVAWLRCGGGVEVVGWWCGGGYSKQLKG